VRALAIAGRDERAEVQEVSISGPGAGEVSVRIEAASVNGIDAAVAAGYLWDMLPHAFPVVVGRDFAGTVEAVGEGVDQPQVGELVAALDLTAEDIVLVAGATGGVGAFAVQLAGQTGATVLATARPESTSFVLGLGATHAVDQTGDLVGAVSAVAPDGITAVIHAAGDAAALAALLPAGGRLASALGATAEAVGRDDITVTSVMGTATLPLLGTLLDAVANKDLSGPIAHTYPLGSAAQALADFGAPKKGKLVVVADAR
jgi:NADPH:quinone reductase-like Zn-dependent oxidoreductase